MKIKSSQLTFLLTLFSFFFGFACQNKSKNDVSSVIRPINNPAAILMVGFRGTEVNLDDVLLKDIVDYGVGGVILFDFDVPTNSYERNITSPIQLKHLISDLQTKVSLPLMVALDQEGGLVNRLKATQGFKTLPSPADVAATKNSIYSDSLYINDAKELNKLGFNVNFAPVVDLNLNPENPIIGKLERSFGADPDTVYKYALSAVKAYNKFGILPVVKHFPGHGSSREDSHLGVVDVTNHWKNIELTPYQKFINNDENIGIMTAHIFNSKLDANWPATLSSKVINGLLRSDMGFDGLVFSDDLQMEAIRNEYELKTTIRQALMAGVDVLVFANISI